ncbi:MAG TPA: TIGR03667 family PPOX class F420-dependent oxidoreductase [Trebonia sp.]
MGFELTDQVQRHLSDETIGWLTTVTASGRPAPRPVWFTWDGTTITIYSQPNAAKLRHIAANDQVSLHFNQGVGGGDVVVLHGRARRVPGAQQPTKNPYYQEKYAAMIQQEGFTEEFLDSFSEAIQITPERVWAMP